MLLLPYNGPRLKDESNLDNGDQNVIEGFEFTEEAGSCWMKVNLRQTILRRVPR